MATKVMTAEIQGATSPARLRWTLFLVSTSLVGVFNAISSILLPRVVEHIDPTNKVRDLATITTLAAVLTVFGLIAGGVISDRSRSRWGQRTPTIAISSLIAIAVLLAMGLARSILALTILAPALWLTLAFYQAGVIAMLSDRVALADRGKAAAAIAMGTPIGLFIGVNVATALSSTFAAYATLVGLLLFATLCLLIGTPEASAQTPRAARPPEEAAASSSLFSAFGSRNFLLTFVSRALMFLSFFSVTGYLFFLLQDYVGVAHIPGHDAGKAVGQLLSILTIAWLIVTPITGFIADRVKHTPLVVGLSSVGIGLAILAPSISASWAAMLIFAAGAGLSFGVYFAIDLKLMSLVLPDPETAGRDLGILGVATSAPQILTPAIAAGLIAIGGYQTLFAVCALLALAGGIVVLFVRLARNERNGQSIRPGCDAARCRQPSITSQTSGSPTMPLRFAPAAAETYVQPLTIRHLLDDELSTRSQEIVYRDQLRLTYADLRGRIGRLADMLARLGVIEGTTVAMLDWDSHRYLEAYFAVPMMGAVLQTANIRLSPAQLQYTLDHAEAEVLLVHCDFLPLVDELRASLPRVRAIVAIMDGSDASVPAWCVGEYEALAGTGEPETVFRDFNENALATTFYTSGTTGLPKAVCFTHRQLVLHTLAIAAAFGTATEAGLRRDDVYMPLTPMFHAHAWGVPYAATMLGLKQIYPGRYEPDRILVLRDQEGVTFSHCVPTVLQMILDASGEKRLEGWHFLIGGSALTRELYDRAIGKGIAITAGYGMSETGPVVALSRSGTDPYDRLRSGTPIPLVSARIVTPDHELLPSDDEALGEVVLRAPWLTPCYPGEELASDALWSGGWLHTQDIATVREDGSIQIRDRMKDVIKTGGEWISSLALEDLIVARSDVVEVAVIGVPDPKWQERPVAVIVPAMGLTPSLEDVRATLGKAVDAGQISRFALVDAIFHVDALPRTSVGKIDKKAIREMLSTQERALATPPPFEPSKPVESAR
jgi:fatty-acyl-CoA synthase